LITNVFIPAIIDGHIISNNERKLLSLPTRYRGLAIPIFQDISNAEFEYLQYITWRISQNIIDQVIETNMAEIYEVKTNFF